MIPRDESEKHFTHRLEAFSDVVMGFSLAQLGVALEVSGQGLGRLLTPGGLFSFVFPFALVCALWFFHHRLFSQLFVPKTWPVVLNFLWLASVVLAVFSAEAYMRHGTLTATRFYFAAYAWVYALLGVQYVIATRYAAERHSAEGRLRGVRGSTMMFLWTIPFLWALVIVVAFPPGAMYMLIGLGFVIAGIFSSILGKRFRAAEARLQTS